VDIAVCRIALAAADLVAALVGDIDPIYRLKRGMVDAINKRRPI
jgi:hypothetical protein